MATSVAPAPSDSTGSGERSGGRWAGARRFLDTPLGEGLLAALLLSLALVAMLWEAVLFGRALLPADFIFTFDPLWRDAAPPGITGAANPLLSDIVDQFIPWRAYVHHWLARGELPLWNTGILAGASLVGNDQSALFYPVNVLGYAFPWVTSFTVAAFARLLIAGLGAYAYLRLTERSRPAAYLGALAFMLSGFLIVWLNYAIVNAAVWLPVMLAAIEWIHRRGSRFGVVLLALATGFGLLGGHIETSFHVLLTATAYAGFLIVLHLRRGERVATARSFAQMGLGGALGLGIGAVQLLPFVAELRRGGLAAERSAGLYGPVALFDPEAFARGLPALAALVLPTVFGSPADAASGYWEFAIFGPCGCLTNFNEYTGYAGTVVLLLAAVSLVGVRRDPRLAFWAVAGLVALGVAFRFPVFDLVNHLPVFRITLNDRLRLLIIWAVIVLAAAGYDLLRRRIASRAAGGGAILSRGRAALLGGLGLLVLVAGYAGAAVLRQHVLGHPAAAPTFPPPPHDLPRIAWVYGFPGLPARWDPLYLPAIIVLVSLGAYWLAARGRLTREVLGILVPVLVGTELILIGHGYNPAMPPEDVFPAVPVTTYLQEHAGNDRVLVLGPALSPNRAMIWNLQDIRAYELIRPERIWTLLGYLPGRVNYGHGHHLIVDRVEGQIIDLLGVRYLVSLSALPPFQDRFRWLIAQSTEPTDGSLPKVSAIIYENTWSLPRAWFAGRARVLNTAREMLYVYEQAGWGWYDLSREVLLEAEQNPPVENLGGRGTVRLVGHRPNQVLLEAEVEGNGYLVLTDSDSPGWEATVNGQPADIYRANYAFRAIPLGPGRHQIEMVYRPRSLIVGAVATGGALLVVVLIALTGHRLARRTGAFPGLPDLVENRWLPALLAGAGVLGLVAAGVAGSLVLGGTRTADALVRLPDTGAVYRLRDGRKERIVNAGTLACQQPPEVEVPDRSDLAAIPDGPPIENREGCRLPPPPGSLVRPIGSQAVYQSNGEELRLVPNQVTLLCLLPGRTIEEVAPAYVQGQIVGATLPDRTGCPPPAG